MRRLWIGPLTVGVLVVAAGAVPAGATPAGATPTAVPAAAGPTTVPATPFVVDVSAVGLGVAVTWNPNAVGDAVASYQVQAQPTSTAVVGGCAPKAAIATAPSTDSRVVVPGLCAQVAYTARMRATNRLGPSPWSGSSAPGSAAGIGDT